MIRHDRTHALLLALLLAGGCDHVDEPPVANVAGSPIPAPTPAPAPTPTAALPAAITITTNEPFHAAAIDGPVLRLSGIDMPERRMTVTAREAVPEGQRWHARDATGAVIATVTARACEDDMSGMAREFSGELRFGDGRTVRGCAFRTPADRLPQRFVGRWDRDAAACADPAASIDTLTIGPRELRSTKVSARSAR